MTTKWTFRSLLSFTFIGLLGFWMSGCGLRRCQEAPTQAFTTFTEQEWRMAEATPPLSPKFSNTNFLIFRFGRNFQGEVYRVENNDRFETPILNFTYNVDPEQKLIVAQFFKQLMGEDGETVTTEDQGVVRYSYTLGRELMLFDQDNGLTYRFVPFTGVVDPDSICEF